MNPNREASRDVDYNEEHVELYSMWPIVLAAGVILIPIGIVSLWEISAAGLAVVLTATMGWAWEARSEPKEDIDE
jgi:uncharacterized membrane protein HdeD (DUF308 family)